MKRSSKYLFAYWYHLIVSIVLLALVFSPLTMAKAAEKPDRVLTMVLSGRSIKISLPFSTANFITPAADDAQQVATAVNWDPFFEVSLESLPWEGNQDQLKNSLQSLRASQAGTTKPAHTIHFFGQTVSSVSNEVNLSLRATDKEAVVIHEWAAQAYDRLWVFRVSFSPVQDFSDALLDKIIITGGDPAPEPSSTPALSAMTAPLSANLPELATPAWWQGDCDTTYYYSKSGLAAYPLGGSYRGVKACGPRPWYDGAPDVLVRFFTGAWGEYEWECVELSMRFLYLAYGIAPYPGNGKDVVANYTGSLLTKISNGSVGIAPLPGDVLSYGPTTTYGHTSVVSASNVDASGNGTITVIEQNSSATGMKTLTVANWVVQATSTVSGWLHLPDRTVEKPHNIYIPLVAEP